MNRSRFVTYLNHFIKARHYRGHGIHSPYLYSYVREVVIVKGDICKMTIDRYPEKKVQVTDSAEEALNSDAYISIIKKPFKTVEDKKFWHANRPGMNILTIHLPHHIVIFRDNRVHNQHFEIRR